MKSLYVKSYRQSKTVEVKLDDDVYEKYKTARIRHTLSGDTGSSYVNVFDDSTGKWISLPRKILNIQDRKVYVAYNDEDETNLLRENLSAINRGDINRKRPPKCYGRMFKGTAYLDGIWYTIVYLPGGQKFAKQCDSEATAAIVYDAVLNYLNLNGYRNFPEVGKKHLTNADKALLEEKMATSKEM